MNNLKIINFKSKSEREKILYALDMSCSRLIVSDLTSKKILQKSFLSKKGFLEEDSVLRASDLWKNWAKKIYPDIFFTSERAAITLLNSFLVFREGLQSISPATVLHYIGYFSPLFFNHDGKEHLEAWMKENKTSDNLKFWFELSYKAWEYLWEQKIIFQKLSGVLLSIAHDYSFINTKKKFVFDLGLAFQPYEVDIIKTLSRYAEVVVLKPVAPKTQKSSAEWVYNLLEGKSFYQSDLKQEESSYIKNKSSQKASHTPGESSLALKSYKSPVAEVKDTMSHLREILDKKEFLPSEIAIVAPSIEGYWPVLSLYAQKEGVPLFCALPAKWKEFLLVEKWMSYIRAKSGSHVPKDWETLFFHTQTLNHSYRKFKTLCSNVYFESDYLKFTPAKKIIQNSMSAETILTLQNFIEWSFSLWKEKDKSFLTKVYKSMTEDFPYNIELPLGAFVFYLETLVSQGEVEVEMGQDGGVFVENISSSALLPAKCIFVLGMNYEAMREKSKGFSMEQLLKLSADLGYNLEGHNLCFTEDYLQFFIRNQYSKIIFSMSQTTFSGEAVSASTTWMNTYFETKNTLPAHNNVHSTRWDEIQQHDYKIVHNNGQNCLKDKKDIFKHDQNILKALKKETQISSSSLKTPFFKPHKTFSASSLSKYKECPFKFYAAYALGLKDDPVWDLDLSPLAHGKLYHELIGFLLEEKKFDCINKEEISNFLETIKDDQKLYFSHNELWLSFRNHVLDWAMRFIDYEKLMCQQTPAILQSISEVKIKVFWDRKAKKFVSQENPNCIHFTGYVDRIDMTKEGYVVTDYKLTENNLFAGKSWVKNKLWQLPIYAQALEASGADGLEPMPVTGMSYFSIKDCRRSHSLLLKDIYSSESFGITKKSSFCSIEEKEKIFNDINWIVGETIDRIYEGEFFPNPEDQRICEHCEWSELCRAPHLN